MDPGQLTNWNQNGPTERSAAHHVFMKRCNEQVRLAVTPWACVAEVLGTAPAALPWICR
jgi:hypothetical protein